jgi:GNAT superfamily N-acetyltransferase
VSGPVAAFALRDMGEADLADGLRLSRASGWNQTLRDWRLLLSLGEGLFCVASEGRRVIGSGGAVRYGEALAWICMILVDPACRGQGLGSRLFDDVLARLGPLRQSGRLRSVGLDATPAGRPLYARRGFREGPALVRMRCERPSGAVAAPDGVRCLAAADDLTEVLERDRRVFGADRRGLLEAALADAPELAWIARRDGRLAGYCFGRHGDRDDQLGPLVADDTPSACALLSAGLPRCARPAVVDARAEPGWLAALAALGFREQRPLTRMYLDDVRPAGEPAHEPAVLGPEFG